MKNRIKNVISLLIVLSMLVGYFAIIPAEDNNGIIVQAADQKACHYLDELPIVESDRYTGNEGDSFVYPIGKHQYSRGNTDINNNSYTHGIECWIARWNYTKESSWAYSVFDLNKSYNSIEGKCVIIKSANTDNFDMSLDFYGDNTLIATYTLKPDNIPFDISLNVKNVKLLKIYAHDNVEKERGTSIGLVDMRLDGYELPTSTDGYYHFDNHTYKFFEEVVDWHTAKKNCENIGGHLATITSSEEQYFIESLLPESHEYYWLGGSDEDDEGNFTWITGEPFIYTNWCVNNPNVGGTEDYLGMMARRVYFDGSYQERGWWNDFGEGSGSTDGGYICEWDYLLGSSDNISFSESEYRCKVGESIPITAIITASELPKNISWKCNDDNIISFSGTSNVGPTVTGKENTWWVSVIITASSNVGNYVISMYSAGTFLASVKLVVYTDIFTGELQAVDKRNKQITIDGRPYTATTTVDYTSLNKLLKSKDSKKVVYQLSEGTIVKICSIFNVLTPQLTIGSTSESFVYSYGRYIDKSLTITLYARCGFNSQESPFSLDELQIQHSLDKLSLTLKEFKLSIDSEYLFLETNEKEISYNSEVEIYYYHPRSFEYTVYANKDRTPEKVTNKAVIKAEADFGTKQSCNKEISIGNLDLQKKQNNQNNLTYNQKLNATKQLINKVTNGTGEAAIILDAYILDYITPEQQKEIEEFLTLYVACAMNAEAIKDETSPLYKNVLRKVCNFAKDKVCDRILDKIKMKKNPFLWTNTLESSIDISGMSKQGKKITITFDIKIESYTSGTKSSDPYAAMCWINYKVRNSNDIPAGAHRSGTGAITWVNMQNFAETMMDFLEVAYDQSWGQHLDDFAEGFVSSSMRKFIKGEFSGNLYKLSTSPIKSSTKKVIIDCPVDVYVYDRNGNECGAIINNTVLSEYNDVFVTVNGDSKIIYLTDDAYSVRIVATDSGTMDYIVEEYEDSNLVRKMTTIDVPLKKTSSFNAFVPDVSFVGGSVFRLHEEDGSAIELTSDTYQPESYTPEEAYEIKSGKCGKNAIWKLYSDGLLIISGSGDTYNYDNNSHSPFYNNEFSSVDHLIVEDGITSVGDYLFFSDNKTVDNPKGLINLQKIEFANSVSSIGQKAFYNCTAINSIYISTGLQTIGEEAFRYCDSLEYIFYFGSKSNLNRVRQMFNIPSNSEKPHIIFIDSTSEAFPGDLNNDGIVNAKDSAILAAAFGKRKGNSGYNEAADFNNDGIINAKDKAIISQNFGKRK